MVILADRRTHARNTIDWPVSVYDPRNGVFINGRSVDVSQGGAKISLPAQPAVQPGQVIEVNFPRTTTLAKLAGSFSRIKTARIVRVEPVQRHQPTADGPADLDVHCLANAPSRADQMVAVHFDKDALAAMQ